MTRTGARSEAAPKTHLELAGLQRCASICGSVWGRNRGQEEEEKPAPRSQGSAKARAPWRGHASDRAHNSGQAAESAEVQEEVGGSGLELDGGCRTSRKRTGGAAVSAAAGGCRRVGCFVCLGRGLSGMKEVRALGQNPVASAGHCDGGEPRAIDYTRAYPAPLRFRTARKLNL